MSSSPSSTDVLPPDDVLYDAIVSVYQSMPQEQRDEHDRRRVHQRIHNILDVCPASSWNLEESQAVLDVLSGILRARQATAPHN